MAWDTYVPLQAPPLYAPPMFVTVSMRLLLTGWKACTLSLLRVWRDKEQKILDEADVIRQRISVVDSSISSSVEHCTLLAREKTALGVQLAEVADKGSVVEEELIEYKAKVKQAFEDLENYKLLLGTLEQTQVDEVAEYAREEEALALAQATIANLKTSLDHSRASHDGTFLAEYRAFSLYSIVPLVFFFCNALSLLFEQHHFTYIYVIN